MEPGFVDVHTHLTHKKLIADVDSIVKRAEAAGFKAIICNGLDTESNRLTLDLAQKYPIVKPALGIYPLNVLQNHDYSDSPISIPKMNIEAEIQFIEEKAANGDIIAIGECGLDGYWVGEETFAEQEKTFLRFIEIGLKYDIPLIIHTRKLEKRSIEILQHHQVRKVNFHCYGSKVKMALKAAEQDDWCFSIPCNARKDQAFEKLLSELPIEKILTETDAPYLAPNRGELNEPANIVGTIEFLAELRGWNLTQAKTQVWNNFQRLFGWELK